MSNFNGQRFFELSGNNPERALSMFSCAFGFPADIHAAGAGLIEAIRLHGIYEAFKAGKAIEIYDLCINSFDHSVDETLTFDITGKLHYVRTSGCGNCNVEMNINYPTKAEMETIRPMLLGNSLFQELVLLMVRGNKK